jgi:hypothetical protein
MFALIDCSADTSVAETYTADNGKTAISSLAKCNVCVVAVRRKTDVTVGNTENKQQFQETGSVLHKEGAHRLSADPDTVEMVREQYKLSRYARVTCRPAKGTPSTKRFL